jgi:hypothetical protein
MDSYQAIINEMTEFIDAEQDITVDQLQGWRDRMVGLLELDDEEGLV